MSYASQLRRDNSPVQNSDYDKMLGDLETVSGTATKKYGALGEPQRTTDYASRESGRRGTLGTDTQRRVQNQAATGQIAQQADARRTQVQMGVDSAIKAREDAPKQYLEQQRQSRLSSDMDQKMEQQRFEDNWRNTQLKREQSELTKMDKMGAALEDKNLAWEMTQDAVKNKFSIQDIENNYKILINAIELDLKENMQNQKLDYDKWVRTFEAASQNAATTTQGLFGIITEVAGYFSEDLVQWGKGLLGGGKSTDSTGTFGSSGTTGGFGDYNTGYVPTGSYSGDFTTPATSGYQWMPKSTNWNLGG